MTYVYLLDVSMITKKDICLGMKYLDDNRKIKVLSLNNEHEKRLSFGAGILCTYQLIKSGMSNKNLRFTLENKPYIDSGSYISIAHSGKYACVAISTKPVSIDIQENIGYIKNIENSFFSENDKIKINNDIHKFYEVWCQKEAFIKLFGYKDLKNIPSDILGFNNHSFYFDSHYGCLLYQDQNFLIEKKTYNQILGEICYEKK